MSDEPKTDRSVIVSYRVLNRLREILNCHTHPNENGAHSRPDDIDEAFHMVNRMLVASDIVNGKRR